MAGFLDRDTRIIDMVLTGYGKRLLSKGDLNFCYWVAYDDEVDYDPFIVESSSLSSIQLSASINQSIEDTLVREATTGYRLFNADGKDTTNVVNPLFTSHQKQTVVPKMVVSGSASVTTYQREVKKEHVVTEVNGMSVAPINSVDVGVERYGSSTDLIEMSYEKDSFPKDFKTDGFFITVFLSGSGGLVEVKPKRDINNDLCFMNDLKVHTGGDS